MEEEKMPNYGSTGLYELFHDKFAAGDCLRGCLHGLVYPKSVCAKDWPFTGVHDSAFRVNTFGA